MKQVSEMPTSGQFVAVFETEHGVIESETYEYDESTGFLRSESSGIIYYKEQECAIRSFYSNVEVLFFVPSRRPVSE